MKSLRFLPGELTPEQADLIQRAGWDHGISIRTKADGDLSICNLTDEQFYQLAHAFEDQWGIPYNGDYPEKK